MNKDFYELRDNIIPQGDNINFDRIMAKQGEKYKCSQYNDLMGTALAFNNIYAIASLNLLVREFNIPTTIEEILKGMYYAMCRDNSTKNPDCCISYEEFDLKVRDDLYDRYGHLIRKS